MHEHKDAVLDVEVDGVSQEVLECPAREPLGGKP
jgi:hypothetical protein